jgi:hypothetical protein
MKVHPIYKVPLQESTLQKREERIDEFNACKTEEWRDRPVGLQAWGRRQVAATLIPSEQRRQIGCRGKKSSGLRPELNLADWEICTVGLKIHWRGIKRGEWRCTSEAAGRGGTGKRPACLCGRQHGLVFNLEAAAATTDEFKSSFHSLNAEVIWWLHEQLWGKGLKSWLEIPEEDERSQWQRKTINDLQLLPFF